MAGKGGRGALRNGAGRPCPWNSNGSSVPGECYSHEIIIYLTRKKTLLLLLVKSQGTASQGELHRQPQELQQQKQSPEALADTQLAYATP
ncbi:hypothetical protein GRJ2_001077200 [Grus japonensis]|uniref:Uncharacterized protein n=1 Tax=Grus japonensis TaxID=30415 RepID=A0ABC9WKW5_GRUJA